MKHLLKEYPIITISIMAYIALIIASIIVHFFVSLDTYWKLAGYTTPFICADLILILFEVYAVKHDKEKTDKETKP